MNIKNPLDGLTIIEMGTSVAAPYAGLILSDLGAEVIKIENPGGGDHARSWGPPFWGDKSSTFYALNRGKKSISIDFNNSDQVAELLELITTKADAVIQNLRPGLLDKFGINKEDIRKKNPSLIWCDIGAFGAVGPLSHKPGYDPLVQAASGIMSVTGETGRPPVRVGVSLVDMGSGMWTVIGLLSALYDKSRCNEGADITTSLFETGLAWMTIPMAGHAASGEVSRSYGSGIAEIVPYQAFKTSDSWLMIAAGNDGLFKKLCSALSLQDLFNDEKFSTNPRRVENRLELIDVISSKVSDFSTDHLSKILDTFGVPNSPLLTVDKVLSHPQVTSLGMFSECDNDSLSLAGIPISFEGVRPRSFVQPPALGENNGEFRNE